MSKKAVDVVLLPSEAMTTEAIETNKELVANFGGEIVLNRVNCLPHISLAMGCVQEKNISPVGNVLEKIASECRLPELKVTGIVTSITGAGDEISVYAVENTPELQCLHERVMKELAPYLTHRDVTADMVNDSEVSESTLVWIAEYPDKASFHNFLPHITIGYGRINKAIFPGKFSARTLALCHLGNHCTCTKILAAYDLNNKR